MGTTVIGGMIAASAIGIFFVPAIFYLVEKWSAAGKEPDAGTLPIASSPAEGD
jgi:HAE1 family hydrophobic/amphiphilic exporter-1